MQEGILSLMQMPRSVIAVDMVKEAGLPYIVLLTDPTTGGVSASFAMLGDIAIAEPGAIIGFAGTRVIEETIRETLPEGFQRAEYLMDHGMVDMVVPRSELRDALARVLSLLCDNSPAESERRHLACLAEDGPAAGGSDGNDTGDSRTSQPARACRTVPGQSEQSDRDPRAADPPSSQDHRSFARPDRPATGPPRVIPNGALCRRSSMLPGTNGKGSVIAYPARPCCEAAGRTRAWSTHHPTWCASTSASALCRPADCRGARLSALLEECERGQRDGTPITYLRDHHGRRHARLQRATPADILCCLETGLGGRLDATNVVAQLRTSA